ncbi:hypothetical protein D3C86_1924990 [compost metagenome]
MLLVFVFAGLAGDVERRFGGVGVDGATPFDGQDVRVRDAVVEHDSPVDFEHVGGLGQIARCHVGIRVATGKQDGERDRCE